MDDNFQQNDFTVSTVDNSTSYHNDFSSSLDTSSYYTNNYETISSFPEPIHHYQHVSYEPNYTNDNFSNHSYYHENTNQHNHHNYDNHYYHRDFESDRWSGGHCYSNNHKQSPGNADSQNHYQPLYEDQQDLFSLLPFMNDSRNLFRSSSISSSDLTEDRNPLTLEECKFLIFCFALIVILYVFLVLFLGITTFFS